MGYKRALEAAGAEVIEFEEFGDWQGTWLALVEYGAQRGWIKDYFGSCSGCDAFEAEFSWGEEDETKLAEFGSRYLEDIMTQEVAEKETSKDLDWDVEAEEMYKFVIEKGRV